MTYKVEKVWKHKSNTCVVVMTGTGHRCGYVGISPNHPLYKMGYSSSPDIIQSLKEKLLESEVGKRGPIDIFFFLHDSKVRIADLFNVHGSLTFSGDGKRDYPIKMKDVWWFGYDCSHAGDGKDLSVLSDKQRKYVHNFPGDVLRSLDYCISECESLSDQLEELLDQHLLKK